MKRLFLVTAMLLTFAYGTMAQNRAIIFEETKVWEEVVSKAKKENKFIFVDCYTDWCGPCKILVSQVFSLDRVADFFNERFVNAKFEMEKDADGVAHKGTWDVNAYPTLLFIDPATGKVMHRLVGAGQPDWLIEGANVATDPNRNLASLIERYNAGERSPEFVLPYLKALGSGLMRSQQNKVAEEYLKGKTLDEMATPEHWELIRVNIFDPFSGAIRTVTANPGKFYNIEGVGQQAIDQHLTALFMATATSFTSPKIPFDKARYDEVLAYYKTIHIPAVQPALFYMKTVGKAHDGDWAGVLADLLEVEANTDILGMGNVSRYESAFIPMLGKSGDKAIIDKAIGIVDAKLDGIKTIYSKPNYLNMKSDLYLAAGNNAAADEAKKQAEVFQQQIQEEIARNNARLPAR